MNRFEQIFEKAVQNKKLQDAVLLIAKADDNQVEFYKTNNQTENTPIILASITKMFTATCIAILIERNELKFTDNITNLLPKKAIEKLHIYKNIDYSNEITIFDLLFQTSGLPDYYEVGKLKEKMINKDEFISFAKKIESTKSMSPKFPPNGTKNAYYSDINYDILGQLLEKIMEKPLVEIYKELIFEPLNLTSTYLVTENSDKEVPKLYYKNQALIRPKSIRQGASGGCISTPAELLIFLKHFFSGSLFSETILQELMNFHKIQFSMGPILYGGGIMQIPLNSLNTLFRGAGELLGHSGSTGSFAFYYPEKQMYFIGNLNQMATPALAIRTVMQLALSIK
jgi:Beta-lactamase class C and other penicillin binding proteins